MDRSDGLSVARSGRVESHGQGQRSAHHSARCPGDLGERSGRAQPGNRRSSVPRAMFASNRAKGAPRQWWMPWPKARCRTPVLVTSSTSSGQLAGRVEQRVQAVAEQVDGGFVAGDDQQHCGADQ